MAFWSDNFADGTQKDPKRKFRFKVSVSGLAADGPIMWWAKTAAKPSFTIASAEHKYLNHTFYYPGSVTWNDVAITMVDPQSPDVAKLLAGLVESGGYHPPTTAGDMSTMTKASAVSTLGTVTVIAIDGADNAIESWELNNAWITDLKFGDLEYGGDDLTEVSMTLKYDWATLTPGSGAAVFSKTSSESTAPSSEPSS
jgi:hypothetical protein